MNASAAEIRVREIRSGADWLLAPVEMRQIRAQ